MTAQEEEPKMKKKLAAVAALTSLVGGLAASPSYASTAEPSGFETGAVVQLVDLDNPSESTPEAFATAPSCVVAYKELGAVQVENNCGMDLRVKVIIAFGPDSACKNVVAGTRTNIHFAGALKIDRVELC
ncbi:hypothetical protein [Candidatus Corynebacterium faecigallinarum]|uniref:hypothetical protein n=1 Tax=Candidatus Corynebacterium faecigallinarum TaxID=2838528 RepID=UPI003FD16241